MRDCNILVVFRHESGSLAMTHVTEEGSVRTLEDRGVINTPNIKVIPNPNGIVPNIVPDDPHMEFFECWTFNSEADPTEVIVDMELAKIQWLGGLREWRNAQLANLDSEIINALGSRNDVEIDRINGIKQHLRDLPQTIDLSTVTTLAELRAFEIPSIEKFTHLE